MINILIPMAGKSLFFNTEEHYIPKPLIEVKGKPLIEWVLSSLQTIGREKRFTFVINRQDNINFYLANTVRLLSGDDCRVVEQRGDAGGALCSCLLAIEDINQDQPLLISNSDQVLTIDFEAALSYFETKQADAGAVVFKSVHPQWSYVRLDQDGWVVATAEKRPISNQAIAGLYYFRRGRDFVESAFRVIRKSVKVNGRYFISSTLNEMILANKRVAAYAIEKENYHSFFSPQKIEQFNAEVSK
jgi:NDP-sugar pyrophosphorylase family protein